MIASKNKCIIYARCSTDENKQDTEIQLKELRRYCEAYGWQYDEISEYGSGFKADRQPKLERIIEKIRLRHYDTLIVYSMDRFSRQSPSKINALLDVIVEQYKCRFIALQQGIDSQNELTWHVVKPLFTYFANKFSKDLGEKIRKGIERKKEKGSYNGGRPKVNTDPAYIRRLKDHDGLSWQQVYAVVNKSKTKKQQVSLPTIRRRYLS